MIVCIARVAAAVVFAGALGGCMTSRAQLDRRQTIGDRAATVPIDEVPVQGYEVSVDAHDGERSYSIDGELLAVDTRDLWVLDESGETLAVPRAEILTVTVEVYDQHTQGLALWTLGGSLSTISHGYFLILSLPIWLATGIATSVNSAATDDLEASMPSEIDQLTQFARFPQGLPPGFLRPVVLGKPEWLNSASQ